MYLNDSRHLYKLGGACVGDWTWELSYTAHVQIHIPLRISQKNHFLKKSANIWVTGTARNQEIKTSRNYSTKISTQTDVWSYQIVSRKCLILPHSDFYLPRSCQQTSDNNLGWPDPHHSVCASASVWSLQRGLIPSQHKRWSMICLVLFQQTNKQTNKVLTTSLAIPIPPPSSNGPSK